MLKYMQLINIMQLKSTSNMESKLLFIFENVNGWLKYIEAKNVALLTLSSALIVCLLQILKSNEFHKQVIFFSAGYFLVVFTISVIRTLWAFVAKLKRPPTNNNNFTCYNINLLFYGDVYTFSSEEYLNLLYESYAENGKIPEKFSQYEKDLAEQIIVNSRLAMRKGNLFNNTIYFIIIAVSIFTFIVVIFSFLC